MEEDEAITRLSALATPSRLRIVRELADAGPEGLASGVLADRLEVAPNTLSTQLLLLSNARLVRGRRSGRSIIYTLKEDALAELKAWVGGLSPQHSDTALKNAS